MMKESEYQKLKKESQKMTRMLMIGSATMRLFDNEKLPFFLCYFDMQKKTLEVVSANSFRLFGYMPSEMEGRIYEDFVVPEDVDRSNEQVESNLKGESAAFAFKNTYLHKCGKFKTELSWFADLTDDGYTFCIAFIGKTKPV